MFVVAGPPSSHDPLDSSKWEFAGRLEGMPQDQWAIDGTVISLHGGLCFVYSGWPLGTKSDESKQEIYIIEMEGPTRCRGVPVRISTPERAWEFSGGSGINEGPQWLGSPDGRWGGVVYSCAGSWYVCLCFLPSILLVLSPSSGLPHFKVGTLRHNDRVVIYHSQRD